MVGHTHQDFLPHEDVDETIPTPYENINIVEIKAFNEELGLFDIPGRRFRKAPLSYLDEHIDNLADWNRFIKPLFGVDCLFLIDDRTIINPIMRRFADRQNQRFIAQLKLDDIPARIVHPDRE